MQVRLGSRVFYKDNGPNDLGTIVDLVLDDYPFVVKFDRQVGECDEPVDSYKANQLVLVEY